MSGFWMFTVHMYFKSKTKNWQSMSAEPGLRYCFGQSKNIFKLSLKLVLTSLVFLVGLEGWHKLLLGKAAPSGCLPSLWSPQRNRCVQNRTVLRTWSRTVQVWKARAVGSLFFISGPCYLNITGYHFFYILHYEHITISQLISM
jgi:hypothetical protein